MFYFYYCFLPPEQGVVLFMYFTHERFIINPYFSGRVLASKRIIGLTSVTTEGYVDITKRIFYLCDALEISINRLADISGVPQSTLQNIVSKDSTATVRTIEKICDGLEIGIEDFFRENDDLPAPALQELKVFKDYLRWKYNSSYK